MNRIFSFTDVIFGSAIDIESKSSSNLSIEPCCTALKNSYNIISFLLLNNRIHVYVFVNLDYFRRKTFFFIHDWYCRFFFNLELINTKKKMNFKR